MASNHLAPRDDEARTRHWCPELQEEAPGHQHGPSSCGAALCGHHVARAPMTERLDPGMWLVLDRCGRAVPIAPHHESKQQQL
jgi:hypothetical protein